MIQWMIYFACCTTTDLRLILSVPQTKSTMSSQMIDHNRFDNPIKVFIKPTSCTYLRQKNYIIRLVYLKKRLVYYMLTMNDACKCKGNPPTLLVHLNSHLFFRLQSTIQTLTPSQFTLPSKFDEQEWF